MSSNRLRLILTLLIMSFLLIGCSNGGTENTNSKVQTNLNISLSALYKSQASSRAVSKILTGELQAINHTTNTTEIFNWSAYLDEDTLDVTSNKTIALVPGDYTFSLLLNDGSKQYVGTSVLEVLNDNTQNTIALSVAPLIGDTIFNVSVVSDLAGYKFEYATSELTSLANPQVGVSIDGAAEDIFAINPATGLTQVYLNLTNGTYNAHLSFYDGNIQVGRSVPSQENITVVAGTPLSIDIVALHSEAEFLVNIEDSNATVKAVIAQEIIDEITLANLQVIMQLSDGNTTYESLMTLSSENNQTIATAIIPNMQFGTYTFSLTFNDITDISVPVGSCLTENAILDTNGSTINCGITLQRRSVIGSNLLAVVGVNVFNTNNEPIAGASVYANGELIGLTNSGTFGTPGYLKTYQIARDVVFSADDTNMRGETNTTLTPLGVSNVDVVLDTPIQTVSNTSYYGSPAYLSSGYGKPWKYDYNATGDALTWEDTNKSLPNTLSASHVAIIGDYVYMFGGANNGGAINAIYKAPVTDPTSWVDTNKTLPTTIYKSQTAVIGSYVYLFGNRNPGSADVIFRAPVTDPTSWVDTGATLPYGLSVSKIAIIGNYIYLFGGYSQSLSYTNKIFRAPVTNPLSWVDTGTTLPTAMSFSQISVIGDYIYLFGGYTGSIFTGAIYRAPVSNPTAWVDTNAALPSTLIYSQVSVIGDYIYLFGGRNGNFPSINAIYRAPVTDPTLWTDTGAILPSALDDSQVAIIGNYVYLFGGVNDTNNIDKIYRSYIK